MDVALSTGAPLAACNLMANLMGQSQSGSNSGYIMTNCGPDLLRLVEPLSHNAC